ncbi:HD domain-containing protein [Zavarzinella formosa]|uniref:HD domain-containing protein n=1 Tax=Zavarzinella formosa TaxID=360055 RepID=UPI0002EDB291|nr:hypothetical protein [Zavarzinella formosa]
MISPEKLEALQTGWVRFVARFSVSPVEAYPVFDRLVAAHSEPWRHYHTLEHIAEMLKVVGRLADSSNDLDAIQLAVWFHDSVYDPKAKDNEARSADLMVEALSPYLLREGLIPHIRDMILATAHTGNASTDPDTMVLLDADLGILASDEWRYLKYAEAIRREYDWVPDDAYRAGRTAVLQAFLNRERIYQTERFHAVAEEPARRNLAAEIERLATGKVT